MNQVLVTGGSGYFGSVLVRKLREQGIKVVAFDLEESPDLPEDVIYINGDIRDSQTVKIACSGMECVYHCAASAPMAGHAPMAWGVNVEGTRNLLQACAELKVGKVVNVSSRAALGVPRKSPGAGRSAPRDEFGLSKLAAENLCAEYAARGLDVTTIRPAPIMGRCRMGIMQMFFEWVRLGRNVPVLGRGDYLYQFVHPEDLARACIKAAGRKGPAVYNIGAAKCCTMRQTLEGLIAHAGTGGKVVSLPAAPVAALLSGLNRLGICPDGHCNVLMYGRALYLDIARAKQELHWAPRYDNIAMACESYEGYLKNRGQALKSRSGFNRPNEEESVLKLLGLLLQLA
jgi:nucleoside-diphosphate-sugar epimerase